MQTQSPVDGMWIIFLVVLLMTLHTDGFPTTNVIDGFGWNISSIMVHMNETNFMFSINTLIYSSVDGCLAPGM